MNERNQRIEEPKRDNKIMINIRENIWIYIGIFVAAFSLFFCIRNIVIACHDDLKLYVRVTAGTEWEKTFLPIAYEQGRFCILPAAFFHILPLCFENWIIYKMISYLGITFCTCGLFMLLYRHMNRESAFLAVLFFFAFAQLDKEQHNVLICYVGALQIVMGFALYAIERYITYLKTRKKTVYMVSCILLVLSGVMYESYIAFVGVLVLIGVIYRISVDKEINLKLILGDVIGPVLTAIGYIGVYFIWRIFYPSVYEGTSIDNNFNLAESIKTMLTFSFGKFPGIDAFKIFDMQRVQIMDYINGIVVLNALMVTVAVVFILKHFKFNLSLNKVVLYIGLGGIAVCIPTCIHALTPKYKAWVMRGTTSYVPSISCFFVIAGILAIVVLYVYQIIKFKKIFLGIIAILVFCLTFITGISNNFYADYYMERQQDYAVLQKIVHSKYMNEIVEDGSQIYLENFDRALAMEIAEEYITHVSGKRLYVTNDSSSLNFNKPVYQIHFSEKNDAAFIARIDNNFLSQELGIILAEEDDVKSIELVSGSSSIYVDFIGDNDAENIYTDSHCIAINLPENNGDEIRLLCNDVLVSKCETIAEKITENTVALLQIDFMKGFYNEETDGNVQWRWSQKESVISVENYAKEPILYFISFDYKLGAEDGELSLHFGGIDYAFEGGLNGHIDIPVILPQGRTEFEFTYIGSKVNAPTDTRELCFRLENFQINSTNKRVSSYVEGLYSTEKAADNLFFNWSNMISTIVIYNLASQTVETEISFKLGIADKETFFMKVNDEEYKYEYSYNMMPIEEKVLILPGINNVSFTSTATQVEAPNDSRVLFFRMFNFDLKVEEYIKNKENIETVIYEFVDGFYGTEELNGQTWRWCASNGTLQVRSDKNKVIQVSFTPSVPSEKEYILNVAYRNKKYEYALSNSSERIVLTLEIKEGVNNIFFSTNAPRIEASNDTRKLYFRVFDFNICEVNED